MSNPPTVPPIVMNEIFEGINPNPRQPSFEKVTLVKRPSEVIPRDQIGMSDEVGSEESAGAGHLCM